MSLILHDWPVSSYFTSVLFHFDWALKSVLTAHPCAPLWSMTTHDSCLSQQDSHRVKGNPAGKERRNTKSLFPSYWVQKRDQVLLASSIRDTYCPSWCKELGRGEGGMGASEWDLYGGEDGGISGREIWIAARLRHKKSFLTKSHFDMTAAAMKWTCLLHGDPTVCIGRINHNKSAHWRDSAGFYHGKILLWKEAQTEDEFLKMKIHFD